MSQVSEVSQVGTAAAAPLSIVARDVHVSYRVEQERPQSRGLLRRSREPRVVPAVRGVSLEVRRGDCVVVVGGNGSGKSTLLRALAGLMPRDSGTIRASGTPVLLGVGGALRPELTARRNIHLGLTALGVRRRDADAIFDDVVAFAEVGEFLDVPLRGYSAGMKARLQFSIATSVRPDILMLDEALAVGDAVFKVRSGERMRELAMAASTVLIVSHQPRSVLDICTRGLWLDAGRVVMDGPAEEVVQAYRVSRQALSGQGRGRRDGGGGRGAGGRGAGGGRGARGGGGGGGRSAAEPSAGDLR